MTTAAYILVSWLSFFNALQEVETGGHADPANAIGDGGRSIGWLQIQAPYQQDSDVKGDVRKWDVAIQVCLGYWTRYCRTAVIERNWQTMARIHNGGPRGARKRATLPYWGKVYQEIEYGQCTVIGGVPKHLGLELDTSGRMIVLKN